MCDDPAAARAKRKPAVAVVARDDAEIIRPRREQTPDRYAVARVERQRIDAERTLRVERRNRLRARQHDLRIRMLLAQLRDERRQQQRIAEQQVMRDQNAPQVRGLAPQRLEDKPRQRSREDVDPAVESAHSIRSTADRFRHFEMRCAGGRPKAVSSCRISTIHIAGTARSTPTRIPRHRAQIRGAPLRRLASARRPSATCGVYHSAHTLPEPTFRRKTARANAHHRGPSPAASTARSSNCATWRAMLGSYRIAACAAAPEPTRAAPAFVRRTASSSAARSPAVSPGANTSFADGAIASQQPMFDGRMTGVPHITDSTPTSPNGSYFEARIVKSAAR
ncbi:hypothetical protein BURPS1710b_1359 [Burkholderia pseudomallei 1710b]|uniref:Uncharacterized protein n=1 Tax=Burkholderia pseudomallei (strain 1710b) TaxID=320372 RepID=Q3JUI4_BURP1|nr:hypothetical protein BURPS1710b_1359 [Burkholderia pseudomallei 1710b]